MGTVTLFSGPQYSDGSYITPFAPGRYALIDGTTDNILGEVHTSGTGPAARATAYRALQDVPGASPAMQAVCPAHLAPCGPAAFALALQMLRRSIADALPPPVGSLMK